MKRAILSTCFCLVAGLAGCGGSSTTQTQAAANPANSASDQYVAPDASGIQVMTVQTTIPDYLDIPAQIEADPTQVAVA